MFDEADKQFMNLALDEARTALEMGDYPVGAALVVDGEVWGTARNAIFSTGLTTAHAEHRLLSQFSKEIKAYLQDKNHQSVCLYTTLEPCLMCLGITVMHLIPRVVIACPDPRATTIGLDTSSIGFLYQKRWPIFEIGLYKEASCNLLIEYLQNEAKFFAAEQMLAEYLQLRASWQKA